MNNQVQNNKNITELFSKFLSGVSTPEEKASLYEYVMDKNNREILPHLKEIWEETPENDRIIVPDSLFEYIQTKIEKTQSQNYTVKEQIFHENTKYNRKINIRNFIIRYAAVFILAFGIAWLVFRNSENNQPAIVSGTTAFYNEVMVPYGSKTMVVMSDSTKVWLNAGARFRYPNNFESATRDVYLQGEAYFEVTKDVQHPFLVHSNGMNIKVLGTKFNLKANADDDFVEATLLEGAIEILGVKETDSSSQNNLVLEPGQKLTLYVDKDEYRLNPIQTDGMFIPEMDHSKAKIKKADILENIDPEMSMEWTKNKLVLTKERFEDVIIKLERWYGVSIEVKDPKILNYHFTGTFDNETFEQAMQAFGAASGCNFKINKNRVTVTR